ncbi:translation elongation factor Ts [Mycoplasma phocimorsus]|uniref:translation elongation factor Ts n=1 Tax=Mycoplasma phocimorsus TaxID=3045839 RepID=UPI0024C0C78F|nr:translation elongation factor Ts [Mycoplasma phocimorsus]MDJ1646337.1 translation elongation factor Ts [Mycoplasma phocimorsus]MDJ1647260.1 translation elongation factor Ts [Mycoplasma phocimorsus]MDJ1648384.1 translation elongation factor Ts [Mycoplasma phocimorsus]MDJ1649058.1 translation elongation factor Ts [Mycoplasma phocimorsus]
MAKTKMELIKEIRAITDAPMIDCKRALEETNYDLEAAIQWLNDNILKKAAKKSGRIAAEGIVKYVENDMFAVVYELNSETDFVIQNEKFLKLASEIEEVLLSKKFTNENELSALVNKDGKSLMTLCEEATGVIGEKIALRRAIQVEKANLVTGYTHNNSKIAVLVTGEGKDANALRNVAMHVAAMNPKFATLDQVPAETVQALKDEFSADESLAKKPEKIQQMIINGKVDKELSEFVLEKQSFVMESSLTVSQYLEQHSTKILNFVRLELAEGIEKVETDFAAEVAAQMNKA